MVYEVGKRIVLAQISAAEIATQDGRRDQEHPFAINVTGIKVTENTIFDLMVELTAFAVAVSRSLYSAAKHDEGAPKELDAFTWLADLNFRVCARWAEKGDSILGKIVVQEPPSPAPDAGRGPRRIVQ